VVSVMDPYGAYMGLHEKRAVCTAHLLMIIGAGTFGEIEKNLLK
jgi:hypothetical protein